MEDAKQIENVERNLEGKMNPEEAILFEQLRKKFS